MKIFRELKGIPEPEDKEEQSTEEVSEEVSEAIEEITEAVENDETTVES